MSRFLTKQEIEKFQRLLASYKPSAETLRTFQSAKFGVIAGPVAAGKDTLRSSLMNTYPDDYSAVLSTTTREPRPGEKDGHDYHFKTIDDVEKKLKTGHYLQGALVHRQQISTFDISEIEKIGMERTGLSILIVNTERELFRLSNHIQTIFLAPPNLQVLLERLSNNRDFSKAELTRRMQAAEKEIKEGVETNRYYCLLSNEVVMNTKLANSFFQTHEKDEEIDKRAREQMLLLLADIRQYLNNISK